MKAKPRAGKPGERYHHLEAIKPTGERDKHGRAWWIFKCDCGKEITAVFYTVRHARKKSCGCHVPRRAPVDWEAAQRLRDAGATYKAIAAQVSRSAAYVALVLK